MQTQTARPGVREAALCGYHLRAGRQTEVPDREPDMPTPSNIFLVGPMGSGKSAVGSWLARRLKLQFADSDRYIEEQTGVDITLIFEIEGEEGFRAREEKAIGHLCKRDNMVLATGGGAVLSKKKREAAKDRFTDEKVATRRANRLAVSSSDPGIAGK